MTATVLKLLPNDEVRILETYINGRTAVDLEEVFDAFGVPPHPTTDRIAVAVAQILLNSIQGSLPNWGSADENDTVTLGRLPHHRHKDGRLQFNPQHICTINWGDSGPGFSWPEAYHVTYLTGFDKYIVTASRDSVSAWGCLDHAIGVVDGKDSPVEAAKQVIVAYWSGEIRGGDEGRWENLFFEGLIDKETASAWADEVWPAAQLKDEDNFDYEPQEEGAIL